MYQLLPSTEWNRQLEDQHGSEEERVRSALSLVERRSLLFGFAVGVSIEGLSLVWHFLVVLERANAQTNLVESFVALLLWSLITTAAPFIVLDHLRGILIEASDDLKIISERLVNMERRFGVGALLGICLASAGIDAVAGLKDHFRFSLIVAAATALGCIVLPSFYRRKIVVCGKHSRERSLLHNQCRICETMPCVDVERSMESTPGTLRMEEL